MHQEFLPPEELHDTIKCFWYDRRDSGDAESTFEVQPDGYAEIIFALATLATFRQMAHYNYCRRPL